MGRVDANRDPPMCRRGDIHDKGNMRPNRMRVAEVVRLQWVIREKRLRTKTTIHHIDRFDTQIGGEADIATIAHFGFEIGGCALVRASAMASAQIPSMARAGDIDPRFDIADLDLGALHFGEPGAAKF